MAEGFVYFIRSGEHGPIKIGWALDPEQRIRDLQIGNAEELVVLSAVPGERTHEAALHKRFREHLIRGEWFRPVPELVAFAADPVMPDVRLTYGRRTRGHVLFAQWMAELGLSQEEAGRRIGAHQTYVGRILRGQPMSRIPLTSRILAATSGWERGPISLHAWGEPATGTEG